MPQGGAELVMTKYPPTKEDLWKQNCDLQERMLKVIERNNEVITKNTEAQTSMNSMIASMQSSLDMLVKQLLTVSNGVPLRVFMIVVVTLVVILFIVVGISMSDIQRLVGG